MALDAGPFFEMIVKKVREQNPDAPEHAIRVQAEQVMHEWLMDMNSPLEREDLTSTAHLQDLKASGVWGVKVVSARDDRVCDACRDADGSTYAMEDALQAEPLPHPACTNEACRCVYLPVKHEPWD